MAAWQKMIAVDTNILVYAHRNDSDFNLPARAALAELAEGARAWAIPWPCVHEFLAIVTHVRMNAKPSALKDALNQVTIWRESPSLVMLTTTTQHFEILADVCSKAKVAGGMIHDARIAAICIENGVRELWTADRDFSRFAGLKTKNPLV
jgi:uncharacterized protein